nr:hypothetical protein [uncultured Enterobacter sp.]
MAKWQIASVQQWEPFEYGGANYSLAHLDAHEVVFKSDKTSYTFVVTYGLHCFAKDITPYNIPVVYQDGREIRSVCMERYEASKQLRHILPNLPSLVLYQTTVEKFFTLFMMNSATQKIEPYKICFACFKEKRLMRMHITSAFFVRTGAGAPGNAPLNKKLSVFKIAKDLEKKPKSSAMPKEAINK